MTLRLHNTLTGTKDGSKVYLGYTTSWEGARTYSVFEVRADGSLSLLFTKNVGGGRVSVDEAGDFYLGGNGQVQKVNARGEPVSSFTPIGLPSLGPVASSLEGTVMLTRDALWDMGHYGFVGRFTRAMKPSPGVVVQWEQRLGWISWDESLRQGAAKTRRAPSPQWRTATSRAKIRCPILRWNRGGLRCAPCTY